MKRVTYVQLQTSIFVPGVGNLQQMKTTLDAQHYPGITMEEVDGGHNIKCVFKNVIFKLPTANCRIWILDPEETKPNAPNAQKLASGAKA